MNNIYSVVLLSTTTCVKKGNCQLLPQISVKDRLVVCLKILYTRFMKSSMPRCMSHTCVLSWIIATMSYI